jgi:hypothetical protein
VIRLRDPRTFRYSGKGNSIALAVDNAGPVMQASVKGPGRPQVDVRLLVDVGSGAGLTLNKPFAESHGLMRQPTN